MVRLKVGMDVPEAVTAIRFQFLMVRLKDY